MSRGMSVVEDHTTPALHEHVDLATGQRVGEPTELDMMVDQIIDTMPVLNEDESQDLARLLSPSAR